MIRLVLVPLLLALATLAGCGPAKRPETPSLRSAFGLLASGCQATQGGAPEDDQALLKIWLGVHNRYPYETNLLRAASESPPDANGRWYGELTAGEIATIDECRARADRVAGIAP